MSFGRFMLWSVALAAWVAAAPRPPAAIFSSYDTIELRLSAPFNDLFSHTAPDDDYKVKGSLGYTVNGQQKTIDDVEVSLRGHTSRATSECVFPKLKVHFSAASAVGGSPFAGLSSVKIGTHCGEAADDTVTATYGRLPNERAPHREAFVYRLLETVGIPTLKARPARIKYVYTDAQPGRTPDQRQSLVRSAMLLEDTDDAVARLGGTREITEQAFTNARDQFSVADTAALAFAEAMIGNFDWCLKMTARDTYRCNARHPLWNVLAVVGPNGRARPVPYDFDVAGMVVAHHRWFKDVYNEAFSPSRSHADLEVLGQVQRTRTLFARADLDAARARFMQKKADAYGVLSSAQIDPGGKHLAQQYLDSFFAAIASDDTFYRNVVVAPATFPFSDAARTARVCPGLGAIPIGTAISEPSQTTDRMIEVILLDTTWHWATPATCPAVHEGSVWIPATAIGRDYPAAARGSARE